jgi:glucose-6-phosphate dehydrogenase assembly protein OpcA
MTAPSATDAFLSGQGTSVELRDVETELTRLWGPAAEREGGPDLDHPTTTRIVLANLVAADLGGDRARMDHLLDDLAPRYPCRAIVLRAAEDGGRKVAAAISASCYLPAPGRPQVCAERIVLRAGREGQDLWPGAVRTLLEADLPVVLWWQGDPRPHAPLFHALAAEASRVVLDLPDPGAPPEALRIGLDLGVNDFTRDIVWFGISPWRELCAQFFDPPGASAELGGLCEVIVDAVSPVEGTPRVSAWLAAWLAGVLGWEFVDSDVSKGTAHFRGRSGTIAIALRTRVDPAQTLPHLAEVRLRLRDGTSFHLARGAALGDEMGAEIRRPGSRPTSRRILAPSWTFALRLASALESARDDGPYRQALPHLLKLIDGAKPASP